jgi:C4-dicarboxylate-binding protein DctP
VRSEAINVEDKQRIVDSGRTAITVLTPEQLEAWQAAMRPVWNEFRDRIGGELVDAALAAAR